MSLKSDLGFIEVEDEHGEEDAGKDIYRRNEETSGKEVGVK